MGRDLEKTVLTWRKVAYCWRKEIKSCLWPTGPGVAGRGGPELLLLSSALAVAQVEAWLEGLFKTMLLQLALTGPAVDLKNSLPRRRLGCYVADCV